MDFVGFVVFSALEAMAIGIIMLQLFRFNIAPYRWSLLIASVAFAMLSYALHVPIDLTDFFPLITLFYFAFFAFYVLKVPLFWAFVMSLVSNILNFALQTLITIVGVTLGLFTLDELTPTGYLARLTQLIFAVLAISMSHYLYRRGIGFAFNFDKYRWKAENIVTIVIVFLLFVALFITFIMRELYVLVLFEVVLLAVLIILALRKERADLD